MIANVLTVVFLTVTAAVAVRALLRSYRTAKKTGNPSCIGCSGCSHKEGECPFAKEVVSKVPEALKQK